MEAQITELVNDENEVLCKNASHKVWKGSGKFFDTVADALNNYKSPEMKSIIRAAETQHLAVIAA
jgi:DNA-binding protein H-NS